MENHEVHLLQQAYLSNTTKSLSNISILLLLFKI